jgi:hypothetical protein
MQMRERTPQIMILERERRRRPPEEEMPRGLLCTNIILRR